MNGDYIDIVQAISDARAELLKEIGTIRDRLGKIEGFDDRMEDIENEQRAARSRQYWHSAIILPLSVILRGVAEHLGIKP